MKSKIKLYRILNTFFNLLRADRPYTYGSHGNYVAISDTYMHTIANCGVSLFEVLSSHSKSSIHLLIHMYRVIRI